MINITNDYKIYKIKIQIHSNYEFQHNHLISQAIIQQTIQMK